MPTVTCKHRGCDATFKHPTQERAQQALRMHEGRVHSGNIRPTFQNGRGDGHPTILRGSLKPHPRSLLAPNEVEAVVGFIRTRKDEYPTKTACFHAALEETGVAGKIVENSVAVQRYFKKAELDNGQEPKPKRKYTRRQQPAAHQVHVNFCPNCGCNLHAVATGMAMAAQMK